MENKAVAQREIFIDFFRAVCIAFVLIGHRQFLPYGIGVFVLPGFFIASGYTFKPSKDDFKTFLVKKIKRLLVPFWMAMGLYTCLEILRGSLFHYGDWRFFAPGLIGAAYGSFTNIPVFGDFGNWMVDVISYKPQTLPLIDIILPTLCHLWFLPALFSAEILMYFYFKYRKDAVWMDLLATLAFLLCCGIETIPNMISLPYGLGRGFFAAACMMAGYYMKKTELFTSKRLAWQITLAILAVIPCVVSVVYKYDGRSIVRSAYGEPMFLGVILTYICGVSFAYVVMYAMYWLAKIKDNPISRAVAFAGANSMDIYLWHFVAFFLMDLFMFYVIKAPTSFDQYCMEAYDGTQPLYRAISIVIAYVALTLFAYAKKFIKAKIKESKAKAA